MAIAHDNSGSNIGSTSPLTFSFTIGGGSNRMLIIGVAVNGSAGSIGATFNGKSFTFARSAVGSNLQMAVGYLLASELPAAGTYTVSVTFTGAIVGTGIAAGVTALTGAKQQAPQASEVNVLGPSTSISTNITTLTNGAWLVDAIGVQDAGSVSSVSPSAGQTQRYQRNGFDVDLAGSTKPIATAGATSTGWTFTGGTAQASGQIVVAIAPDDGIPVAKKDIKTRTGSFSTPGATGNFSVTGLGFQPKAIFLWGCPVTNENANTDSAHHIGIAAGGQQRSIQVGVQNGTTNTFRARDATHVLHIISGSNTNLAIASLVSFDSGGFTLNFSTATTAGLIVNYVAFGGTDLSAQVVSSVMNTGGISGLSFQPEFAFFISYNENFAGSILTNATQCFGVANDELAEWSLASAQGSLSSAGKDSVLRTTSFMAQVASGAMTYELSISGVTTNGLTWTGSDGDGMEVLAFNLSGIRTFVGRYTKTTAAAPAADSLPNFGFVPQIYGLATANKISENPSTSSDGAQISYGVFDRTRQVHTFRTDVNNQTRSHQRTHQTKVSGSGNDDAVYDTLTTSDSVNDATPGVVHNPNENRALFYGVWAWEAQDPDTNGLFLANF